MGVGSAILVSAIPPQPNVTENAPISVYCCATTGQRVVYGTTTGVVVRCLPDQVSFQFPPVEAYFGVKQPILAATMSPDNSVIAGGDGNGTVYVWIRSKQSVKQQIFKVDQMQYVKIRDLAISPDGQRLAIGGVDRYAKKLAAVILADAGNAVGNINGHTKGVASVHFRPVKPHTIVSGGLDGNLILHDGPPYKVTISVVGHEGGVSCARFSPDGNEVVSCGADYRVTFWDSKSLSKQKDVSLPNRASPLTLAWSPDSSKVAVVTSTDTVCVISQHSFAVLQEIKVNTESIPEDKVKGIFWSRQKCIGIICAGGHIKGYKIPSTAHEVEVSAEGLSPNDADEAFDRFVKEADETTTEADAQTQDEKFGLSKSTQWKMMQSFAKVPDGEFKMPAKPKFVWYGPKGSPTSLSYHRESGNLAVGTTMGALMFLSTVDSLPCAFQVSKMPVDVTVKSTVMSEKFAAAVTSDGVLKFFKVVESSKGKTGATADQAQLVHTLDVVAGEEERGKSKLSRRLELCATAEIEGAPLKLILLDEGKFTGVFTVQGNLSVFDSSQALTGGPKGIVQLTPIWTTQLPGRILSATATGDGTLMAIAMIPNPDYPLSKFGDCIPQDRTSVSSSKAAPVLAAAASAESAAPGDTETQPAETIAEPPDPNPALMLDSFLRGKSNVTPAASADPNAGLGKTYTARPLIEIYEIDSAATTAGFRFIYVLDIHKSEITSLALDPGGCLLASTDLSKSIRVTEIGSREAMVTNEWSRHSTKVVSMDWSPDGSKLVSGSTDNEIYVWDIDRLQSHVWVKDAHTGGVNFVRFLFNNMVASGGSDGLMKVFEIEYDKE